MKSPAADKVLLVDWAGADWRLLGPLMDAGVMPHLSALVARGVMGGLAPEPPYAGMPLWTTLATGVRAAQHRVLDDWAWDAQRGVQGPVPSTACQAKPLWRMAHEQGLASVVINWPVTAPVQPLRGIVVPDAFYGADAQAISPATGVFGLAPPDRPAGVHPASLRDTLAEMRIQPEELSAEELCAFAPEITRVDTSIDRRPERIATLLAYTASVHGHATFALENEDWQVAAVRYPALAALAPHFAPLRAPQLAGVPRADFEVYRGVLDGFARLQDRMLGRLVELAGPRTTVMLVSGMGMGLGDNRLPFAHASGPDLPRVPDTMWMRPGGMICVAGPATRADELVHGASILDVVPTALAVLGLPVGTDMPGRVLWEAFHSAPAVRTIATWGPPEAATDAASAPGLPQAEDLQHEALAQLFAAGYDAFTPEEERTRQRLDRRNRLHEGFALVAAREWARACDVLEPLLLEAPEDVVCALALATSRLALGESQACDELARRVQAHAGPRPAALLLQAMAAMARSHNDEALALLEQARAGAPGSAMLRLYLGRAYAQLGKHAEAAREYRLTLQIEDTLPAAHFGLALSLIALGQPADATTHALAAVNTAWRWPQAHCALGVALAQCSQLERARLALQTSLQQGESAMAHAWLAFVAARSGDQLAALRHRRAADDLSRRQASSPAKRLPKDDGGLPVETGRTPLGVA